MSETRLPVLTDEQRLAVTEEYLRSLQPGFLPGPIFSHFTRLATTCTVEFGMVRQNFTNPTRSEILLTQRPPHDKHWPNQWHVPGTVLIPGDDFTHEHDYDKVIERLLTKEVGGTVHPISEPQPYDFVRRKGSRGEEVTVRVLAEVAGEPERGVFYDTTDILESPPEGGLVETHNHAIRTIAARYALVNSVHSLLMSE